MYHETPRACVCVGGGGTVFLRLDRLRLSKNNIPCSKISILLGQDKPRPAAERRFLSGSQACVLGLSGQGLSSAGELSKYCFLPSTTMHLSENGFSNVFPPDQKAVQKLNRVCLG